jgi:hypothetical protein
LIEEINEKRGTQKARKSRVSDATMTATLMAGATSRRQDEDYYLGLQQ